MIQVENLTKEYGKLFASDNISLSAKTADRIRELLPHIEVVGFPNKGHSLSGLSIEMLNFAKDVE